MTSHNGSPGRSARWDVWAPLVPVLGAAIVLFFRLGDGPPSVKAEVRCWDVVSGMTATGDWLVPRRNGEPFLTKPPLFYWAASAISRFVGGATFATLRMPSALAAVGLLLLTFAWGRSVGGLWSGIGGVVALALMWQLYESGRLGSYDMLLAFFCNGALLTFDRLYWSDRRSLVPLFFLLVLGGFLTKGPPAILVVGVPIVLFLVFRRELRRALSPFVVGWALLFIPLALVWFAVLVFRVPEAHERFLSEAVLPFGVETRHTTAEHFQGPLYYAGRVFSITRPACLLLPLVIWRGWRTRFWSAEPRLRYVAWVCAGLFVAFSIFPQKRDYYLLPIFPALSILVADSALWAASAQSEARWAWLGLPALVAGLAMVILSLPVGFYLRILLRVPVVLVCGPCLLLIGLGGATILLSLKRNWTAAISSILVALWMFALVYFGSYTVWRHQFETETVSARPDFDAAHWSRMKAKYPTVARIFHSRVDHSQREDKEKP